jgi:hypothetical protein
MGSGAATLGGGWLALTGLGVRAASGAGAHGNTAAATGWRRWLREAVAHAAPGIFVIGLLLLCSLAVQVVLNMIDWQLPDHPWLRDIVHGVTRVPLSRLGSEDYWTMLTFHPLFLLALTGITAGLAFLLAWRIDVNEFSMHDFYKNRLVRAYLGASRPRSERRPNAFTGFDLGDDIKLVRLRTEDPVCADLARTPPGTDPASLRDRRFTKCSEGDRREAFKSAREGLAPLPRGYAGPFPLINAALNITRGEDLARQERKAESFVFTPLFCGYEYSRCGTRQSGAGSQQYGYRPTRWYGYAKDDGIALGTAVAISGAAANPSMGYHSSPAVAFLMTVFNARLGWWLGNPIAKHMWMHASPRLGLFYLLKDLTSTATDRSDYVSLSDGGHFDNLGIYELVRRRCRFIIAVDAEADPGMAFDGLGNVIRQCRTDFGVEIRIDLQQLRANADKRSAEHCAVGSIRYPEGDTTPEGEHTGVLVYLKASLTGDEPAEVLEYASRCKDFPHESTGDQWFSEAQFESYRQLGSHITRRAFAGAQMLQKCETNRVAFFEHVASAWLPAPPAGLDAVTRHGRDYADLLAKITAADDFRNLDPWLDGNEPDRRPVTRQELYQGYAVIDFMYRVYVDLRLEHDRRHAHYAGWLSIFRKWKQTQAVTEAWNTMQCEFPKNFCTFFENLRDVKDLPDVSDKSKARGA